MKVLPFKQAPGRVAGMVRVVIVKKGLFRFVAELPEKTYLTICELAEAEQRDPVDHIVRMAMRYYSEENETPSRNNSISTRVSI